MKRRDFWAVNHFFGMDSMRSDHARRERRGKLRLRFGPGIRFSLNAACNENPRKKVSANFC